MRLWFWSILSLQNWHYSFLAMKTLYLFLHPSWGVKNSIFWSDNGIGQDGTICHSTWKLDNVMFSIHTASAVAKKSKVNLHKSHFLGLMPQLGLGPAGLKTSRKKIGLELPPFPAVSLEEKLMLETRLPPTPVVCWMEEHGTLVCDMESWQSSMELKHSAFPLRDPKEMQYKHPLFKGAALDWDWPELGGYRNTDYQYSFSVGVTHAVPCGGVDNRLVKSVFSKPTDPSYVLHFHIDKCSQWLHSVVTDL